MSLITALEPQQRRAKRTNVYIDGRFFLGVSDEVVARLRLRTGENVDENRLRDVSHAEDQHSAYELALRFLEPRPRTRREIAQRLARAGHSEDIVEPTLEKLASLGLIDDAEFAGRWIEAKTRPAASRPTGRRRLASDLQQKGVDKEIIEEAVASVSDDTELTLALQALRGKSRLAPSDPEARAAEHRRLTGFLARRGFGWETIRKALKEIGQEIQDEDN